MNREQAFQLLQKHNNDPAQIKHALESEAVMRALASHLNENEELWGITGLLHDLDYGTTKNNTERHGLDSAELLAGKLPQEALNAIQRHAYEMNNTEEPQTRMDFALRCGETITGLVHTAALVRPTKMEGMKPKSLKKKMKDKAFAASVNRDAIRECSKLNIELGDFLQLAINAITEIAPNVGLTQ